MKFLRVGVGTVLFALAAVFCADCVAQAMGFEIAAFSFLHGWGAGAGGLLLCDIIVAPFPVDPQYTGISIMYKNNRLIADGVLPRKSVGLQNFKYRKFPIGTFLTIPETVIGRKGVLNEVEIGYTDVSDSCVGHGLKDTIPQADVDNSPQGYDPKAAAVEHLTQLTMLDREKRVADMVFNTDNYASTNKVTLSGGDQLSHVDSEPIDVFQTGIDACIQRPNACVMGRSVARSLFSHADIVKAINGTSGDKGIVSRDQFANLFEFDRDKVFVGEGWYNIAKPGQTPVKTRVWGKSILLFYLDDTADANRGITFGLTAQWGTKIARVDFDKDYGLTGAWVARQGEFVKEVIKANDLGYLIDAAVA
jgi:hypothetical protein